MPPGGKARPPRGNKLAPPSRWGPLQAALRGPTHAGAAGEAIALAVHRRVRAVQAEGDHPVVATLAPGAGTLGRGGHAVRKAGHIRVAAGELAERGTVEVGHFAAGAGGDDGARAGRHEVGGAGGTRSHARCPASRHAFNTASVPGSFSTSLPLTNPYVGGILFFFNVASIESAISSRVTPGGSGPCEGRSSNVNAICCAPADPTPIAQTNSHNNRIRHAP